MALAGSLEVSLLLRAQKPYYPICPVSAIKHEDPAGGSNEPHQLKGHRSEVPEDLNSPKELTKGQGKSPFL